jgi:hypothetical protein
MDNFIDVKETYKRVAAVEIEYRNLNIGIRETLIDSFNSIAAIISKGKLFPEDYKDYLAGMKRIRTHVLNTSYSIEVIEMESCRVAYLIANILADNTELRDIEDIISYKNKIVSYSIYSKLNHMRRRSLSDFAYLYEAIKLIEKIN